MKEHKQIKIILGNGMGLNLQSRYKFLISFIIYRIMLDICYFRVLTDIYAYRGYIDNRNWRLFVISWLVFFAYFFALDNLFEEDTISITNIIFFCWSLLIFVPFTTLIYSGILSSKFILYNFIYTMILIIAVRIFNHINFGTIHLKINKSENLDFLIIIIGILSIATIVYVSYRYTGFRLNFDLEYVYDLRLEARTYSMPTIIQYLFSWAKIINNILLVYCLINKRWILAFAFFVAQMISFGIDGAKTPFFMTFIVIVISFMNLREYQKIKRIAVWGAAGLTAVSFIEPLLLDSTNIASYIIRRVMFVPVSLGDYYVDFFSTHTPDYFRGSFLRYFGFESQYTSSGGIARTIGAEYLNSATTSANNGLISDAIANLGVVGIFVMPILLVIILKLMDMCASGADNRIYFVVAIYFALCFTNSSLFTVILTHGMLISTIIFLLISSQKQTSVKTLRKQEDSLTLQGGEVEKISDYI